MKTKIIEIIVAPDGQTRVHTKGFLGTSCRDASRFLEQALGQRLAEQPTAELHQTQANHQIRQQRA